MSAPRDDQVRTNHANVKFRPTIRHAGVCGHRRHWYRAECRKEFGLYKTVEELATVIVFRCHGSVVPVDPIVLRMIGAGS